VSKKRVTTVVNIHHEPCDVLICRPTKWGNPFPIGGRVTRERAIQMYEAWIRRNPKLIAALPELAGKRLGCHCKPLACHGDVLIRLLDEFFPGLNHEEHH